MPTPVSTPLGAALTVLMMAIGLPAAVAQNAVSAPDSLSETYRDWIVTCRTLPSQDGQTARRLCEMTQELRQQESGQRVLATTLRRDDEADAGLLTMLTPFGLNVTDQVVIEIDGSALIQAPFQTCLSEGCIVQMRVAPAEIEILSKGTDAIVRLPMVSGADVEVTISLLGLSAAWDRLGEF